jgi:hypothetical protein
MMKISTFPVPETGVMSRFFVVLFTTHPAAVAIDGPHPVRAGTVN